MGARARSLRERRLVGEVLAAAAEGRQLPDEVVAAIDGDALLQAAVHHRIVGTLHHALRSTSPAQSTARALAAMTLQATALHRRAVADMASVGHALDAAGIPWMVVKGPALASHYPEPGMRLYGDLDIVVPREHFLPAVRTLQAAGLPLADRNLRRIVDQVAGQLNLVGPRGTAVDLHWHLLFSASRRRNHRIDMDALFERSASIDVDGHLVRTTGAVDTLLHVALHAAAEGADRLVWLVDVARVSSEVDDWATVVDRAEAWRVSLPVGLVLARSRRVVGASVPAPVIRALLPPAVRPIVRGVDRVFPVQHASGRWGTPASFVARASGPTIHQTVLELSGRLRSRARWALRTRSLARPSGERFPEQLGSPYASTGRPEDLESFLRDLAGSERPTGDTGTRRVEDA